MLIFAVTGRFSISKISFFPSPSGVKTFGITYGTTGHSLPTWISFVIYADPSEFVTANVTLNFPFDGKHIFSVF